MARPINIADWTERRGDHTVYVHASLFGNNVKLFECEETPAGIGRDCVEVQEHMLREIMARLDSVRVDDERQGGLGL